MNLCPIHSQFHREWVGNQCTTPALPPFRFAHSARIGKNRNADLEAFPLLLPRGEPVGPRSAGWQIERSPLVSVQRELNNFLSPGVEAGSCSTSPSV